jgi:hypothetical protein
MGLIALKAIKSNPSSFLVGLHSINSVAFPMSNKSRNLQYLYILKAGRDKKLIRSNDCEAIATERHLAPL